MKYLFFILALVISSCGTKSSDSATMTEFEEEEFNKFLEIFKEDSLFQMTRTEFPFTEKYWDLYDDKITTEKITKENWRHLEFEYKDEYATRQIDAYKQEIKIYTDSANIYLQGIDNGIHVRFKFLKKNGHWFLVSKEDLST